MSASRTKRRFLFHGRDETPHDDGTIAADDSMAFARVSVVGRIDPSHPTASHQRASSDDISNNFGSRTPSNWPLILYIPNLLGYIRILLAFHGMKHSIQLQFNKALNTWIAASLLDLIDGIAARKLNQCSQFGILLDIIADNILRTVVWISCMILLISSTRNEDASANAIVVWTAIICLEWITMFCSQQHQSNRPGEARSSRDHWKDVKRKGNTATTSSNPPFWVQAVFHNNFRSPFGMLAIYGLFVGPLGSYVWYASDASTSNATWPTQLLSEQMISILIAIAYIGRTLSAAVELWLCWQYLSGVIARDSCGGKRMS
jgi:phosphatidylglycerophosphate synthase